MSTYNLTSLQKEVYDFIKRYVEEHRRAPYIREVQNGCGITSYKGAVDRLLALEKKGYIKRRLNKHRGIMLNNVNELVEINN